MKKGFEKVMSVIQSIILLPMVLVYYVYYFYIMIKTLRKSDMSDYYNLSHEGIKEKITEDTSTKMSEFDNFLERNTISIHLICLFFWVIFVFHAVR